jgi:hypothetical protein
LEEQVLHVDVFAIGWGDHGHLAGQRVGAAEAVDLTVVGGTHDLHEELIALDDVSGKVPLDEVGAFGGPTSHDHASDTVIHPSDRTKRL